MLPTVRKRARGRGIHVILIVEAKNNFISFFGLAALRH
jgi:hypothetical protein